MRGRHQRSSTNHREGKGILWRVSVSITVKRSFSIFPSPAGMSLTNLSLGRKSLFYGAHSKKKVIDFPVPSRDVTYQTLTKLVSDIPAGDGKIINLFLQCMRKEERHIPRQIRKKKRILLR
jgi:hypothetical protein